MRSPKGVDFESGEVGGRAELIDVEVRDVADPVEEVADALIGDERRGN